MKNKTTDYILGIITGMAIMFAAYSYTTPLQAHDIYNSNGKGDTRYNPLYVKVVE